MTSTTAGAAYGLTPTAHLGRVDVMPATDSHPTHGLTPTDYLGRVKGTPTKGPTVQSERVMLIDMATGDVTTQGMGSDLWMTLDAQISFNARSSGTIVRPFDPTRICHVHASVPKCRAFCDTCADLEDDRRAFSA
ncbi:hypothetical protein PBI_CLUBL_186 [Gordonia phage ClubL]|uniref:Uncharacterized protein n=1 Tax=Gordonia phage ClubL TaxID=1838065 RepID=A0A161HTC9_9CAUD|nr:hypothetical protein BH768_gp021 [Gordonia phage ClubL]ANA86683.1 hypothetical protein PBI_CLUBL_186 [Gordonia phage ClubL]